jgi:hypothetical protein
MIKIKPDRTWVLSYYVGIASPACFSSGAASGFGAAGFFTAFFAGFFAAFAFACTFFALAFFAGISAQLY